MKTKHFRVATSFALWLVCASGAAEAAQSQVSNRQSQQSLDLTIYDNFAVVRDVRQMVLPQGEVLLEYQDVASTLKPSSVLARTVGGGTGIDVLEQSYRYDLLNRESLLDTYIGRKMKYSRTVLQGNTYEKVLREGILLSTDPEIVDFGDEIEISPEGTISLPDVPEGLILNPSLVWLIDNPRSGKQQVETIYMADNLSWRADYVLTLGDKSNKLDLASWATVRNDSGTLFRDANIKLVAGTVNQVFDAQPKVARPQLERTMMMSDASSAPQVSELSAYQVFDLPRTTSVLNHEEKQIKFLEADAVKFVQHFRLRSQVAAYSNPRLQDLAVTSEIEIENTRPNKLGLPLPKGTARVYQDTAAGPELIGESRFSATPLGQSVTLALGQAFDLTADRQQVNFSRQGDRVSEAEYEINLSNARAEILTVEVEESMQGDWEIIEASESWSKLNSQTLGFNVSVPAEGSKTVRYRVRWKN